MVQGELQTNDWVVHKKGGWYHDGDGDDGEFFTQLGRVVSSCSLDANGKDCIIIETALSVEPLHYLVTPTDELEKVQLFDEPRRRGEAAKYAKTFVDDINKSTNMWFAASYFKLHGIEKPDVLNAFTDFNKKFMDKAKRMSKVKDLKPSPPATSGKRKRKDSKEFKMTVVRAPDPTAAAEPAFETPTRWDATEQRLEDEGGLGLSAPVAAVYCPPPLGI